MYFIELTEEQKLQVSKDTTYTVESLEDEDPYLIPADEMSEYIMELFYDTHTIEEAIEMYIDEEKVIRDYSYDYTETEFDNKVYFFRSF